MSQALRELSSETLADQAYEAIHRAIATGELARGTKITERGLAVDLGVSPTPVREALRRLEQDRLVERTGPRSVRVAQPEAGTVQELSMIQSRLRSVAARLAATNATDADRREMARALDKADAGMAAMPNQPGADMRELAAAAQRVLAAVREFHAIVDRACANEMLQHMLRMTEAFTTEDRQQALGRMVTAAEQGRITARYSQHREIYDAIVAGDGDRAEQLMLSHIDDAADYLIEHRA